MHSLYLPLIVQLIYYLRLRCTQTAATALSSCHSKGASILLPHGQRDVLFAENIKVRFVIYNDVYNV